MPIETEVSQATRRGFMTAVTAMTASSYNRILGANERVGIGFIGFGLIGKQHIYNFKTSFPDVDRVALCDVYKPRVEEGLKFMDNPNAKGYSDFRKMYEDKNLQAVVVGTPDHWHALLTILACEAGKDVYVEKPVSLFVKEGRWMVMAARRFKRIVTTGTQRKIGPQVKALQDAIAAGRIGKVHRCSRPRSSCVRACRSRPGHADLATCCPAWCSPA